jgi:hypothetical protein
VFRIRFLSGLLLLPFMLGCSAEPRLEEAEIAKPQMLGLTKQEVTTCMGRPDLKLADGRVETWQFPYGTCTVNLTIGPDDRVKAVNYTIQTVRNKGDKLTGPLPTENEQCEGVPEVASCVRWLRH